MLDPSRPFYVALFGAMKLGAISVPLLTLFGPDGLRVRVNDRNPVILITNAQKAEMVGATAGTRVVVADTAFFDALGRIRRHNAEGNTVFINGTVTRKYEENGNRLIEISQEAINQTGEVSAVGKGVVGLP
jgi:acyl-coenzyme A synthetase/AMP-(fatty) acid ligase